MTNKAKRTGLAGAIGVLLMLQPAAALSAFEAAPTLPQNVCHRRAADQPTRRSRRGRLERRGSEIAAVRSSGSRSSSRSSSGRTGFSSYSGSRQGSGSPPAATAKPRAAARAATGKARVAAPVIRAKPRSSNVDSRQQGRTSRTDQRQSGRNDRVNNRSNTRRDAVNNWDRYGNGWYSGSSWSNNRPWNNGWYGGSYYNNWRWYPGQAAAWGLAGMATFGTINSLVNSAQSSQVSYIEVPNSDYSLYYPSVTATGDVVSFEADNGYDTVRFNANCRDGTLNGGAPLNANEAQLLNAACQVAFGQ